MKSGELALTNADLTELAQTALAKGAAFRFRTKGFSMSPFIKDGDVVTISFPPRQSGGLGRVAAFMTPETKRLLVHRIIGETGGSYLVKGDGCNGVDGLVPTSNVLGYVIRIERSGKGISLGLGPERFIIAWLSRMGALKPLFWFWRLIPFSLRQKVLRYA